MIVTLRFDFHIGKVECVTCHVPWRKETEGTVKSLVLLSFDVEGGRKFSPDPSGWVLLVSA